MITSFLQQLLSETASFIAIVIVASIVIKNVLDAMNGICAFLGIVDWIKQQKKWFKWLLIISIITILLTVVYGISPDIKPTPDTQKASNLPRGNLLYMAQSPGPDCDIEGGHWGIYHKAEVICLQDKTQITNASQTEGLKGILLEELPGKPYPNDYVVQARFQQNGASFSSFGVYFRNQLDDQEGVYTFLMHSGNTWDVNVYDNNTGVPSKIRWGNLENDVYGTVTLAVVVKGNRFSFYANERYLGSVDDETYPIGTAGIVLGPGSSSVVSNFALYKTV